MYYIDINLNLGTKSIYWIEWIILNDDPVSLP